MAGYNNMYSGVTTDPRTNREQYAPVASFHATHITLDVRQLTQIQNAALGTTGFVPQYAHMAPHDLQDPSVYAREIQPSVMYPPQYAQQSQYQHMYPQASHQYIQPQHQLWHVVENGRSLYLQPVEPPKFPRGYEQGVPTLKSDPLQEQSYVKRKVGSKDDSSEASSNGDSDDMNDEQDMGQFQSQTAAAYSNSRLVPQAPYLQVMAAIIDTSGPLWVVPEITPRTKAAATACQDRVEETFIRIGIVIARKWKCNLLEALPEGFQNSTPYSLALFAKLGTLASRTSSGVQGRPEAHGVLSQICEQRVSTLAPGTRKFVVTVVAQEFFEDNTRLPNLETHIQENEYGVMLCDVNAAIQVLRGVQIDSVGARKLARQAKRVAKGLHPLKSKAKRQEKRKEKKKQERKERKASGKLSENEEKSKQVRREKAEEKAVGMQQQQPQKKKKQVKTPRWLQMQKANREGIVEAAMVKYTDFEQVKQRVEGPMSPPKASEVARAGRISSMVDGTRMPMFSNSAIVTRATLKAPKKVKGGGNRHQMKDDGRTVAEVLKSLDL
ncbi:hypothetical protein LTR17_000069 [Elasticomyces elasticus]|nr:hypothetical protein LTR17_000069 [Elasticomyces elasticus]